MLFVYSVSAAVGAIACADLSGTVCHDSCLDCRRISAGEFMAAAHFLAGEETSLVVLESGREEAMGYLAG